MPFEHEPAKTECKIRFESENLILMMLIGNLISRVVM